MFRQIKVQDPRCCEVADRLGMPVRTDLPNRGLATPRAQERTGTALQSILQRYGNQPSIQCRMILN